MNTYVAIFFFVSLLFSMISYVLISITFSEELCLHAWIEDERCSSEMPHKSMFS